MKNKYPILNILKIVFALFALTMLGATGFMVVEGWNFFDSLYMAVITMTTVGYGEVHPLSNAGRVVAMVYLMTGLGFFLFGLSHLGEVIIRSEFKDLFGRKKLENELKKIKDHYIICGYGRMGEALAMNLIGKGERVVIIDKELDRVKELQTDGLSVIHGDVTDDKVLMQAGVTTAKGLAVVLSHDADNLFVVMSARLMNAKLQILSRASDENGERKMQRAGADKVVSPYKSGAARMAHLLLNPHLDDFIEIFDNQGSEVDLAQITITESNPYNKKTLGQSDFSSRGVVIVGIRKSDGRLLMPPTRDTMIEVNDILISMGKADAIGKLISQI